MPALMWFRNDLRLHDNAALTWAAKRGPVVALLIDEPAPSPARPLGAAATWWREQSIRALAADLGRRGVPLLRRRGDARTVLPELCDSLGVDAVSWSRRYHEPLRDIDAEVKATLRDRGIDVASHPGFTLVEPWEVTTKAGDPFRVFTPFSKAARLQVRDDAPLPIPDLSGADVEPDELGEAPSPAWATGLAEHWAPEEAGARKRLEEFMGEISSYGADRDVPAQDATSHLSPHLASGDISPREVWFAAEEALDAPGPDGTLPPADDVEKFRDELLWRDFAWHRLFYNPELHRVNVRRQFDHFDWAWRDGELAEASAGGRDPRLPRDSSEQWLEHLGAWRSGTTGISLVDAGMRELWHTGYMHNRVRMVVGSFLTKNLGIHWRHGEEWFWDCLVDADPAANAFNWQWVAGCGDDAAPYFRIFNPEAQAKRFDPHGEYIATWVPPLDPAMPAEPIVDLKHSRRAALDAYGEVKAHKNETPPAGT